MWSGQSLCPGVSVEQELKVVYIKNMAKFFAHLFEVRHLLEARLLVKAAAAHIATSNAGDKRAAASCAAAGDKLVQHLLAYASSAGGGR